MIVFLLVLVHRPQFVYFEDGGRELSRTIIGEIEL